MNFDGDSFQAHEPISHPLINFKPPPPALEDVVEEKAGAEEVDNFQNHFVIKRKPVQSAADNNAVINQNLESNAVIKSSLKVIWESGKLNPQISKSEFLSCADKIRHAGDGQHFDPINKISEELATAVIPPVLSDDEYQGKSKVASLIAKFNQAAAAASPPLDVKNRQNNVGKGLSGSARRVTTTNNKPLEVAIQITDDDDNASDVNNLPLPLLDSQDGDKKSTTLLMDHVLHKYFPQDKAKNDNNTSISDASNHHHRPNSSSVADSLVASMRNHLVLDEQKQSHQNRNKHQHEKRIREDKSNNNLLPVVTQSTDKPTNKPLCPFRIDKQAPKNTNYATNLIFGGGNKAGKPHPFGPRPVSSSDSKTDNGTQNHRPISPYIDMSSFKGGSLFSSPLSGLIKSTKPSASSPMDKSYPGIKNHVFEIEKSIHMEDIDVSLGATEKQVLSICEQRTPIPINSIFQEMEKLLKVGEGVFGEVFLGQFNGQGRVYKVVPIEGEERVNGEKQKTFNEIFPEIAISKQLSKLSSKDAYPGNFTDGYIKLYNTRLAKGAYPEVLVDTWRIWDERHSSDNDCPCDFSPQQLYLIFEFDYGGKDAEAFVFQNSRQAFCLVLQIAHTLAIGECAMEFEHRDLHWGNILVQNTEFVSIPYTLDGKTVLVPSGGIKSCIIDFTIARVINAKNSPVFLDLKDDEEQFLGTGDHQFDIYRMMRDCNRNEWAPFCPKTNTYWIHYLADKLMSKARYFETESAEHVYFLKQLQALKSVIMRHDSCRQFVFHKSCEDFKKVQVPKRVLGRPSSATMTKNKMRENKRSKRRERVGGTRAQS